MIGYQVEGRKLKEELRGGTKLGLLNNWHIIVLSQKTLLFISETVLYIAML